jgi:F0F1-type ATP synthase membrane subunit b/b'
MKRAAATLLLAAALAIGQHTPPAAQQGEGVAEHLTEEHETAGHGNPHEIWWKWANFVLLASALGYLIRKHAAGFFSGRTADIRRGIDEADKARAAAEARMNEVDARLANVAGEIEALKESAAREQAAEAGRLRAQTAAELAKIQTHGRQEIEAAGKAARAELKRYAAQLALGMAEDKIRQRVTPEAQDALVRGFAERLPQRPS